MATRYQHDDAAFTERVLCAPFMVHEMGKRAGRVLAHAEAHAPFDAADEDGTHYRDKLELEVGVSEGENRRAYGRVKNTDMPTAVFVEFGTKNNPRHRTLGNALDAAKD